MHRHRVAVLVIIGVAFLLATAAEQSLQQSNSAVIDNRPAERTGSADLSASTAVVNPTAIQAAAHNSRNGRMGHGNGLNASALAAGPDSTLRTPGRRAP